MDKDGLISDSEAKDFHPQISSNDVQVAWAFFHDGFSSLVDKHAPLRRYKVKGRDNPWFTPELSELLRTRNLAWATARKTGSEADWLTFRQLRNRFTFLIKKLNPHSISRQQPTI